MSGSGSGEPGVPGDGRRGLDGAARRGPARRVRPRRGLVRTSLGLLPVQLVLRGAEAALPLALAVWFGRSRETDAFVLLWSLAAVAGALVFSAFHDSALAPVLIGLRARDDGAAGRLVRALFGHVLAHGGAVAGLCGLAGLGLVRLVTGRDAAGLVAPFAVLLVATGVRTLFAAVLNAHERYRTVPLAGAAGGAVTLLTIFSLRGPLGLAAAPLGLLAGEAVAAALLWWAAGRPRPTLERPPELRELARLVAAEIGGSAIARLNPIVDQLVVAAAGLGGGATLLRYAGDVAMLPTSLLQAALLSVLLSRLSQVAAAGDRAAVGALVRRTLLVVVPLLTLLALGLFAARGPLFRLVYGHGEMGAAGAAELAALAPALLAGVPGFGALLVLARAHVALRNSRILPRIGLFSAGANLALDVLLVGPLGLTGVALATSLTSTVVALVFAAALARRLA